MRDELSNLISHNYSCSEIEERISYLLNNCLTLDITRTASDKTLRLARHKLDLVSDMDALTLDKRKTKRAKRNL